MRGILVGSAFVLVLFAGCGGGRETAMEITPEDQRVIEEQRRAEEQILLQGRQQMMGRQQPAAPQPQP